MNSPDAKPREARTLSELSPQQWKSGIAAWLGWLFDGLDMHLYTLVAGPFVAQLLVHTGALEALNTSDPLVKEKASYIQAAFLVGWALGGGLFGRLGDLLGRSRALCLTILTYALFTGLSFFAQSWLQLMVFRFVAALGIGGEWAVGAALLSETWPKKWRPWIAAVLQSGVNIGILFACAAVYAFATAGRHLGFQHERYVFLIGVLPALLVFWIRRKVPETESWHAARAGARGNEPGITDLFAPAIRRITIAALIVCACSLTAWWGFIFWHVQHLRSLDEIKAWDATARDHLITTAFFLVVGVSITGNFFSGWLAQLLGYRRSIALMFAGLFIAMAGAFVIPRPWQHLVYFWFPLTGFFSGVFGLFTMYLPPLFPVLLRTTGAGFCYNIGRIASAAGTIAFAIIAKNFKDFRIALLCAACLIPLAIAATFLLPESRGEEPHEPVT